eukprot:UN33363
MKIVEKEKNETVGVFQNITVSNNKENIIIQNPSNNQQTTGEEKKIEDVKIDNNKGKIQKSNSSNTDELLVPPISKKMSSVDSWGTESEAEAEENKDKDDLEIDYDVGDEWHDLEKLEKNTEEVDLNPTTIKQTEWQCVRCSTFNMTSIFVCACCGEKKNPFIKCDICDVPVPFMCYEQHMESHKKQGHKSPIGIAFSIVRLLRDQTSGIPSCVCWDFSVLFVRRFFKMANERGIKLATPKIVYHWTPEKNLQLIIDGNLKVPDGRKVLHQTDQGYYGKGVYTSPDPQLCTVLWARSQKDNHVSCVVRKTIP